jgi:Protein of unknown function (DUF2809)
MKGMVLGLKSRTSGIFCLAGIIAVGILSRVVHTGLLVFDKYLGDALYAAMVYTILRLSWMAAVRARLAVSAMAIMTVIELFQLTMIPAHLLTNEHGKGRRPAEATPIANQPISGTPITTRALVSLGCVSYVS